MHATQMETLFHDRLRVNFSLLLYMQTELNLLKGIKTVDIEMGKPKKKFTATSKSLYVAPHMAWFDRYL